MRRPLHYFLLFFLISFVFVPLTRAAIRFPVSTVAIDDEYDAYKKKGDDLFKAGRYPEARRQYQNCLEVPGFENDAYAKGQIDKCSTGLTLRQQIDDALRGGKGIEAISLFNQLLALNVDDAITKTQLADYYEREGNQLYGQQKYAEAKNRYVQALKFTTSSVKEETLRLQIRNAEGKLIVLPSKHIGLKVFTGIVAVGAGAYALLLRNNYQTKLSALNQISQTADPTSSGTIDNPDTYRQYNEAYNAVEAAQQKNGLYKACIGVAAVATIAEVYLLVHKPKPRKAALTWQPSTQSWGLAVRYTF